MAGFSGFCLTDEEFPIIYVNNTSAKARQIFTLFHELAHLLFHTSGIDVEQDDYIERLVGDSRRIEVLCNRFAGEFLVPREALAEALRGIRIAPTSVADLSRRFKVSQLVIWRRLRDTNRISHAMYEDAHQRALAEERQPRDRGGDYYNNQLAYLGRPYVGLALSRYYQNKITEEQLADYLNIKPKNIAPLEERFLRGAA
jgi:Zn-dependent peptidase ImmA (M78 family)